MPVESERVPQAAIVAERDYLRKLMAEYSKETSDLEKYALTLAGAIWSWAITHSATAGIKVLFFLPVATTSLFGLRALSVYKMRSSIRDYLDELQSLSELPDSFGWEHYVLGHGLAMRVKTAKVFWTILQLGTLTAAVVACVVYPL